MSRHSRHQTRDQTPEEAQGPDRYFDPAQHNGRWRVGLPPKSAEGQIFESRDEIIAFSLPTMALNTPFAKFFHVWGTTFRLIGWHFLPNTCPFFESIRYSLDIAGFVELHDPEAVAFFAMLVVDDGIVPIIIKCHYSNRH